MKEYYNRSLRKEAEKAWTEFIWLRIWTSRRLLLTRQWTFRFHKMQWNSSVAEELLASQKDSALCNYYYYYYYIIQAVAVLSNNFAPKQTPSKQWTHSSVRAVSLLRLIFSRHVIQVKTKTSPVLQCETCLIMFHVASYLVNFRQASNSKGTEWPERWTRSSI